MDSGNIFMLGVLTGVLWVYLQHKAVSKWTNRE